MALDSCNESITLCEETGQNIELAYGLNILGLLYRVLGSWDKAIHSHKRSIVLYRESKNKWGMATALHNLGHILKLQHRVEDAGRLFEEALSIFESLDDEFWIANCELSIGEIEIAESHFASAQTHLEQSLEITTRLRDNYTLNMVLVILARTYWHLGKIDDAMKYYQKALVNPRAWSNQRAECDYLTEFCLYLYEMTRSDSGGVLPYIYEAKNLAQKLELNNQLARLRLTEGHVAWDGNVTEWENGFENAFHCYQHALIYAVRYNRFLLDEILSELSTEIPAHTLITHCLERGREGRKMLIELRNWWQTGTNDIGVLRQDTNSPIPEGIPLLEAEKIAREQRTRRWFGAENGDGTD